MAIGGNLAAGQSALVGENGPELFTASSAGHVTPANHTAAMVGGNRSVVVHANTNADPHEIAAQVGWLLRAS